jgi:hypothetical protein
LSDETMKLKLPSDTKLEQIREVLQDDEDWRFGRVKMDGKKPRFELPAPTKDEPDNIEIATKFCGVVLVAKKNFYQSDEDKEAGNEPKEKRALYILRLDRYMPELMYVSPTAIRNWKYFARDVVQGGKNYYEVICEFSAEQIRGKNYTWSKPKFAIAHTLTDGENAHVQTMRELVMARVQEFESNAELDDYEDQALSVDKSTSDVVNEDNIGKRQNAAVESDEDEAPVASVKNDKKSSKEAEKKTTSKKDKEVDEEEEEIDKKTDGRAGYPSLDLEEDSAE